MLCFNYTVGFPVVRNSSKAVVKRRPGRGSPRAAATARLPRPPRHRTRSARPRAGAARTAQAGASPRGPAGPTLRANPYPEVTDLVCRLPLPTLFYRLEAVHLGDLLRL